MILIKTNFPAASMFKITKGVVGAEAAVAVNLAGGFRVGLLVSPLLQMLMRNKRSPAP